MAAPTFIFSETNLAAATVTDTITSIVFASIDANSNTASLAVNNPITVGNNSFEKWTRLKVTGVASNSLSAFGVYFGAAPTDQAASSAFITMKFQTNTAYPGGGPLTTNLVATVLSSTQTAAPGQAFTAPANTLNAYSGFMIQQMLTTASATGGNVNFPSPWTSVQLTYS